MNNRYIHYNLQEIDEEIQIILQGLKRGENYSETELYHSIQHILHHVHIAWNARNTTAEEVEGADLTQWSQAPSDIKLI